MDLRETLLRQTHVVRAGAEVGQGVGRVQRESLRVGVGELAQLGEEGAIQVFRPEVGGPMLLGAVGQLQFEVVQHRLKGEYDCDVRLEGCQYTGARWITADTPAELRDFVNAYPVRMALDAANTLAYLCTSPYDVRLAQERFPKIHFHPLREHAGLSLQNAG